MASYFSNFTNAITTTVKKSQQAMSSGLEPDGDTPDDSHICRALRTYYKEKEEKTGQRPPLWLPDDPRAAPRTTVVTPVGPAPGNTYGGGETNLGSFFKQTQGQQSQQPPAAQSLRTPRSATSSRSPNQFPSAQRLPQEQPVARPLPSSNANSYQTNTFTSAKDRLRMGGKKDSGSARSSPVSQSRYEPPPTAQSGGGSGDYDPYRAQESGYGGSRGGGEKAYLGANAPWSSNDGGYGGYAEPQEAPRPARIPQGLPSGPRGGRGLPSGPRGYR